MLTPHVTPVGSLPSAHPATPIQTHAGGLRLVASTPAPPAANVAAVRAA